MVWRDARRQLPECQNHGTNNTNDQPVTSVVVWTFNMTLPK